jgi:DNA-binding XRE family transcriptional regulator
MFKSEEFVVWDLHFGVDVCACGYKTTSSCSHPYFEQYAYVAPGEGDITIVPETENEHSITETCDIYCGVCNQLIRTGFYQNRWEKHSFDNKGYCAKCGYQGEAPVCGFERKECRKMRYSPIGDSWDDFETEIFTPEEIAASDLRVALINELICARNEKGITQRELEELSGVSQPVIARMESGAAVPKLDTVIKVLAALGKTLAIVPLETVRPAK